MQYFKGFKSPKTAPLGSAGDTLFCATWSHMYNLEKPYTTGTCKPVAVLTDGRYSGVVIYNTFLAQSQTKAISPQERG